MGKLHADNNGNQETAAGIGSESGLSHAPNLDGPGLIEIHGGTIYAKGGDNGAGIGGGYHWAKDLSSGTIHISGGEVYAWGKSEGAGIGVGENGKGADVTISGGIVETHAGENEVSYRAIGPGRDNDNYGSLNLGDQMMVRYKIGNNWSEPVPVAYEYGRKAGAWYHTEARVEPCTHPGFTAETCPYHVHP